MSPLRVVVAGGGVAALEAVLALRALAGERTSVELLAPGDDFVHRPSSVLTPFSGAPSPRVRLDRLPVARLQGALAAVDVEGREVRTTGGRRIGYDRLIVATGARSVEGVPGATTFRGPHSAGAVEGALRRAAHDVVFVVPDAATWTLPLYELALLAAHELPDGLALHLVTPEREPLELFGHVASEAVHRLLEHGGIRFHGESVAETVLDGALLMRGGRLLSADAVIALPRLLGPRVEGLPADEDGFIPIDEHARVVGAPGVLAAGDATAGPVKQGGLAAQQADAAAEQVAAEAGADLVPRRYRPVLRGLLLTGGDPLYLRAELVAGGPLARRLRGAPSVASRSQLWWPPAKVAGRHLASFLATESAAGPTLAEPIPVDERTAAYQLLAALADEDAAAGDYASAVEAIDSAAAMFGGTLPEEVARRRAAWAQGEPVAVS
jgi:sulfide:quinone oxidoreductase